MLQLFSVQHFFLPWKDRPFGVSRVIFDVVYVLGTGGRNVSCLSWSAVINQPTKRCTTHTSTRPSEWFQSVGRFVLVHPRRLRHVRWRSHAVCGCCRQGCDVLWARSSSGDLPRNTRASSSASAPVLLPFLPSPPRRRTFHGAFRGKRSRRRFSAFMAPADARSCAPSREDGSRF